MLYSIKMRSYQSRVRQTRATFLEIPIREADLYLQRKMREYTVKHFKKIWCIEYSVGDLKSNMEMFEQSRKSKDERRCNEIASVKRLRCGEKEKDDLVQKYVSKMPRDRSSRKLQAVISPVYKSPRIMCQAKRPISFTRSSPSLPVSNDLEILHLDDSVAAINIEPLTAIMDTQEKVVSTEKETLKDIIYLPQDDSWKGKESADLVVLGPHGTTASADFMMSLDWSTGSQVTRKLLAHIFGRETLASHTLTGKPSPAFKDRDMPDKKPLDPKKVADIVHAVTMYANCTAREVRMAITTKCADENKMLRNKTRTNKENSSPALGKGGKSYSKKTD